MYCIRSLRERRGYTQAQLAQKTGVHQTAVSQWERGATQPRASMIPRLLIALDCRIEDVYREEETNNAGKSNPDH